MQNLKPIYRKWKKKNKDGKILRLFQGDDNLILDLSRLGKYRVSVYFYKSKNNFELIEQHHYTSKSHANNKFEEISEEF